MNAYETWDELVAAEANGYIAVAIMQERGRRRTTVYAYAVGPFDTHRKARNAAASLRRKAKREDSDHPSYSLLAVNVRPLWKADHR